MSAHSLAELAPSSCEPEQASPGSSSESYLAPVCGTDFGSSLIEVAEDVDPESQLEKKASAIHTLLKKHGHFLVLLVILATHTILALSGRSSANYNLSFSLGACNANEGINSNASHVGEIGSCFRMNQTFGS